MSESKMSQVCPTDTSMLASGQEGELKMWHVPSYEELRAMQTESGASPGADGSITS